MPFPYKSFNTHTHIIRIHYINTHTIYVHIHTQTYMIAKPFMLERPAIRKLDGRKVTSSRSGLQEVPQDFEEKVAEAETEQLVDQRESDDGTRSSKAVNHPSH